MKKLFGCIAVMVLLLTGCVNSIPTQEDLLSTGFTYESDDYDSFYMFTSPDEEYGLAVGSAYQMNGYLAVGLKMPEDEYNSGEFEFYIPYKYLGTDITSPEQEAYYSFIDEDGTNLGKSSEWVYNEFNNAFSDSEYSDQWQAFQDFIVENFKDEEALQNEFNFNQES